MWLLITCPKQGKWLLSLYAQLPNTETPTAVNNDDRLQAKKPARCSNCGTARSYAGGKSSPPGM